MLMNTAPRLDNSNEYQYQDKKKNYLDTPLVDKPLMKLT